MVFEVSLREHKTGASNPDWTFSKPSASICRATSTTGGIGNAYMFFVCDKAWLHNKYIRIRWQADVTWSTWSHKVRIYDGEYDRSSDTDFPSGSGILIKGNGLLQTGLSQTGDFGPVTEEFLVDVSGASLDKVTVFVWSRDAWSGQSGWIQVDWIELNSGSGGSGKINDEQFTDSVTMEVTGTTGDYGYISEGYPQADSVALSSNFTVRNVGSGDLSTSVTVRNIGSADLSSSAFVYFIASADLSSSVYIYFSAYTALSSSVTLAQEDEDLSSSFTIRRSASVNLSSSVIIYSKASNDLSSSFTVRNVGSADLSSTFTLRKEGSLDLSSSFTIRRSASVNLSSSSFIYYPDSKALSSSLTIVFSSTTTLLVKVRVYRSFKVERGRP